MGNMLTGHVLGVDDKITKCCEILASNSSSVYSSVTANVAQELEDRERRNKNELFFNIPEPDASKYEADHNYISKRKVTLILILKF